MLEAGSGGGAWHWTPGDADGDTTTASLWYMAPKWSPPRTPGDADGDTMTASRWYTAYAMQRQAVDRAATSGVRGLSGDSPVLVDDRTELASAVGLAPLCLDRTEQNRADAQEEQMREEQRREEQRREHHRRMRNPIGRREVHRPALTAEERAVVSRVAPYLQRQRRRDVPASKARSHPSAGQCHFARHFGAESETRRPSEL